MQTDNYIVQLNNYINFIIIGQQLTGVNVVDEQVFKLEGRRTQSLLWEEHGFRIFFPEDALLPHETCLVSVKAIVGGRFRFPEDTEPVSAVYAISLSKQLCKPARIEMQHCVKLDNPEHSKAMSFAVASQDPSSMPYRFHEVPGGIFEEKKLFGSINRQQFCFMAIIWKLLGYGKTCIINAIALHLKQRCMIVITYVSSYRLTIIIIYTIIIIMCSLDIKCIYSASTFTQKVKMCQLWILAVSKDLDTMKRVR